jgi:NADPH-dependent 2,4-dienoyl-CoA reductase/sulfur reductase-like enzyme
MRTEVTAIDLASRRVTARTSESGREYDEAYDQLVYATGSVPMRPGADGFDAPGVYGVQVLDDGAELIAELDSGRVERSWSSAAATSGSSSPRRARCAGSTSRS